jgi:hypothetical protein
MDIEVLTAERAIEEISNRYDSAEWWILPVESPMSLALVKAVSKDFYDRAGNDDAWVLRPHGDGPPSFGIVFLRKILMTPEELAKKLRITPGPDGIDSILWAADMPGTIWEWLESKFCLSGDQGDDDEE